MSRKQFLFFKKKQHSVPGGPSTKALDRYRDSSAGGDPRSMPTTDLPVYCNKWWPVILTKCIFPYVDGLPEETLRDGNKRKVKRVTVTTERDRVNCHASDFAESAKLDSTRARARAFSLRLCSPRHCLWTFLVRVTWHWQEDVSFTSSARNTYTYTHTHTISHVNNVNVNSRKQSGRITIYLFYTLQRDQPIFHRLLS